MGILPMFTNKSDNFDIGFQSDGNPGLALDFLCL